MSTKTSQIETISNQIKFKLDPVQFGIEQERSKARTKPDFLLNTTIRGKNKNTHHQKMYFEYCKK